MVAMDLPAAFIARPLSLADAQATFEVAAADEAAALEVAAVELADIVADWQRPSFDIATRTIGVFDRAEPERLVGYAQLTHQERGEAAVLPSHHGHGIGTALAAWLRDTARANGATIVGMPVPEGSAGDRLLTALGYHIRWTSWVLHFPDGASVPARDLPAGYVVRAADPHEYAESHDVVEDAFLEWSARERESYGDFEAEVMLRPGFEPWHFRVVVDPAGRVAAVAVLSITDEHEVYINKLATRADQRGRGLAQCLLLDCFARAKERGGTRFGLSTDSRTGALGLYQKVGMAVTEVWVHRAIHLT